MSQIKQLAGRKHGYYYVIDIIDEDNHRFNLAVNPQASHRFGRDFCNTLTNEFKASIVYSQPTEDYARFKLCPSGLVQTPAFVSVESLDKAGEFIEAYLLADHIATEASR